MKRLGKRAFQRQQEAASPWSVCPTCSESLDPDKAVVTEAASPSADRAVERGDIGPDDRVRDFVAALRCTKCNEDTFSAGRVCLTPEWEDDDNGHVAQFWVDSHEIQWLSHYPQLVQEPDGVPWDIQRELRLADRLFWRDLGSCATVLRRSVEVFLDLEGVTRTRPGKKPGESDWRSLENRIDEFVVQEEAKSPEKADRFEAYMRATKLLGNDGTHGNDQISEHEVRLAAGFLEQLLIARFGLENELLSEANRLLSKAHPSPRARRKLAAAKSGGAATASTLAPSPTSVFSGGLGAAAATSSSPAPAASPENTTSPGALAKNS